MRKKKHIAITGGIGSGKSYVAQRLKAHGIDVYDCDDAAKRIMATSADVKRKMKRLVGNNAYIDGKLNKPVVAQFLLMSDSNREAINNIVHPAVADDYMKSGKHWIESAILFDSGFDKKLPIDKIICVTAPTDVRIRRIVSRDGISSDKAKEWIDKQQEQDIVRSMSDYEIVNDGQADIDTQIDNILNELNNNNK